MDIYFATEQLARTLGSDRGRAREFGSEAARRLDLRLQQLRCAPTLHDVRGLPGRCRELRATPNGSFAIDVHLLGTLIFRPHLTEQAHRVVETLDWTVVDAIVVTAVTPMIERRK